MSNDFNWQTEDNEDWDDETGQNQPTSNSPRFILWIKEKWPLLAATAVFLLIIGLIVSSLLNRQVEQAENSTTADILAAHSLVRQAALDKDFDILAAFLSGRNRTWNELQLDLLNLNLFLDRQPLSLKLAPEPTANQHPEPTVTLSPDLQTAEVKEQFLYQIIASQQPSRTIWLEHTFYYQRQDESWLLAPIPNDDSFWGTWNDVDYGDYFTLVYSDLDEPLADFLGLRFDRLIDQICSDSAINCPNNFHVELRLDRQPVSILRLNESYFNISATESQSIHHVSLPSPTLIGRPQNETGYEAIYHGYANWLAAIIANRFSEGGGFPQVRRVDETLAAWGFEPPPDPILALPLVESLPNPPIPFPEQDILLSCPNLTALTLLRYNPQTNQWSDELAGHETPHPHLSSPIQPFFGAQMTPLPDDSGLLFTLGLGESEEGTVKLVSWQAGQERLWLESQAQIQLVDSNIQQQFDPSGQNIVIFEFKSDETNATDFQVYYYVLNLQSCQSGSCDIQDYNGFPYWSPDLSWLFILDSNSQNSMILRNAQTGEEIFLENSFYPYWLNDGTYIYARNNQPPETSDPPSLQILTASVNNPLSPTVMLESDDIAAAITGDDPTASVAVHYIIAHPDQSDWLFFAASTFSDDQPQNTYILSYRRDTAEIEIVLNLEEQNLTSPLQILPDGQTLTFRTFGSFTSSTFTPQQIKIVPLDPDTMTAGLPIQTYELTSFNVFDWSQDGRWLLIPEDNALRLIAPGHNYDQTISHGLDFCYHAAWVNPFPESNP